MIQRGGYFLPGVKKTPPNPGKNYPRDWSQSLLKPMANGPNGFGIGFANYLNMRAPFFTTMKTNLFLLRTQAWLYIGAFAVLLPIFAYVTAMNINRQRENSARILMEKGTALIRSFEAGTRMGMMGRFGAGFKLQRLLYETSRLPDIEYLMVVNSKGEILAHGNPVLIGRNHGGDLDLKKITTSETLRWRLVPLENGQKAFEVYGKFSPAPPHPMNRHVQSRMNMHDMLKSFPAEPDIPKPDMIIFVGLDMSSVDAAQLADTQHMILMGTILLLLAFLGISLILLMVRYRSTKESLMEARASSDSLRQEIARNQRLVTVGRLAAGIAHEIRNPLSSIKGFATYFKQRYSENQEDARISGIMIQEVERLNTVVNQLLEFARPVNIQKKKTSVKALVADSLKMIENQALEKKIIIETAMEEDLKISMDPNRMNQVLLNLYLNAIESMENGGRLRIQAYESLTENGFHIKVSDTGCGIKAEDLNHIFDLYYTTKSYGTGIGLAIVSNIMEAHHGKITVESTIGQGSAFDIFLPEDPV
ncbi:MAG: hypothetical protein FP816_21215 [Desulfobacteraceae bacterium]|nr:hypothetical protein [Desulfobacteraceae bacterium]